MNIRNIFKGDRRTALVKKNIAGSLVIKGWSCIIQFLIVPLSLQCLSGYEYGLWLTINSIFVGIDAIDVGLGNGLRNRLAEAMARNDKQTARMLVSSTFGMLIITIKPKVINLSFIISMTDCYKVMNVDPQLVPHLNTILIASLSIMGATFIFKCIGNIYLGMQLPAINNLLVVSGQTVSLLLLFVISLFGKSTLLNVVIAFTLSPLIVYIISYPITFCKKYKFLAPSIRFFNTATCKDLLSLGLSFFIIQLSGLLLFMSSNFIISKVLTPAEVSPYQISYRYFNILYLFFTIIVSPLWSATTDAYTKGDWTWINKIVKNINRLLLACILLTVIMYFVSPIFYKIWIGDKISISTQLSALMAVYSYVMVVSNCYSYLLFGIGKIRVMTIMAVCETVLFVPIEFITCRYFGTTGLVVTLISATLICASINIIQFKRISQGKAKGLWNK